VVSYGSEEVAEKAIMILKDVFTNLGPRLLANQVIICYLFSILCTDCQLCFIPLIVMIKDIFAYIALLEIC